MEAIFRTVPGSGSLGEGIISQITDAIIGGRLKPGDRLPPERELAEQFGVSRTALRDAVKTLSGRGLLKVRRGAGIFVASAEENMMGHLGELSDAFPLHGAGLQDLFEVRRTLEVEAAEWAAQRRSAHHVERLREILEDAARHEDPRILSERDAQFHVGIAEASQNLVLVRVMLTLLDLPATACRETLRIPGRARLSLNEHARILEEIEARDAGDAREAMMDHLRSVESAVARPGNREPARTPQRGHAGALLAAHPAEDETGRLAH